MQKLTIPFHTKSVVPNSKNVENVFSVNSTTKISQQFWKLLSKPFLKMLLTTNFYSLIGLETSSFLDGLFLNYVIQREEGGGLPLGFARL